MCVVLFSQTYFPAKLFLQPFYLLVCIVSRLGLENHLETISWDRSDRSP